MADQTPSLKARFARPVFLLATLFFFAPGAPAAPTGAKPPKAPPTQWLRDYSLSPYGEVWTLTLSVKDLDGELPKIVDAAKAENGALTAPLETFVSSRSAKTQQLSIRLAKSSGDALLKKLKALGSLDARQKRPNDDLKYLPEIRSEIRKLKREQKSHPKSLAAMPNVSEAISQLIDRLSVVASIYQVAQDQLLVNLTIRQTP